MNNDHFAIVIGLSRYPKLGEPPPDDLNGPENDARAVYEWLVNPQEGGLPKDNVRLIVSSDLGAPAQARPSVDDLQQAFLWLDDLAQARSQGSRYRRVGARLYLYASGHGFSPGRRHGCILTAEAENRRYSANVFPTGWMEWLQDAEYFREYVLWMDSCMDRVVGTQPTPPPLEAMSRGGAAGPSFVAFAAQRNLKAVEKPLAVAGGAWRGIFTWNLLLGLRGAAVNAFGAVTGRSLADWLRQSQLASLTEEERRSPDIAKEPAIIDEHEAIVFARGLVRTKFAVELIFPPSAVGATARIWAGAPAAPIQEVTVQANAQSIFLEPGLYLVDVPNAGLRQGFTVARACRIDVRDQGQAAKQVAGLFELVIDPGDPTAEIQLVGQGFQQVDFGAGVLKARLPNGLYEMRIRIGRQIVEKVLLLDADWPPAAAPVGAARAEALPELPEITSAIPLSGTRASHEYHGAAAREREPDVRRGKGAALMVMARTYDADRASWGRSHLPWQGVKVTTAAGEVLVDLGKRADELSVQRDPVAVSQLELSPGAYELRYTVPKGGEVAQTLLLAAGWRTEAYLLLKPTAEGEGLTRHRISMLMRRIGEAWGDADDLTVEKARVALADERSALSAELRTLLTEKFRNPIAGILGGHMLVLEYERGERGDLRDLDIVVRHLRNLVGERHPDVEALSLLCVDQSLHNRRAVGTPPIFERSWRILLNESQARPGLVSEALWKRVHAYVGFAPFFTWSVDERVKTDALEALSAAMLKARGRHDPANSVVAGEPVLVTVGDAMPTPTLTRTVENEAVGAAVAAAAPLWSASSKPTRTTPARRVTPADIDIWGVPPAALKVLRKSKDQ